MAQKDKSSTSINDQQSSIAKSPKNKTQPIELQTVKALGGGEPLEIFPPEVYFKEIEIEQSYETTITVRNISSKVKRIRVMPPKTGKFLIDPEMKDIVAPGLAVKIVVAFESEELGDFHDELTILCDDYKVAKDQTKREFSDTYKKTIRLHAFKPSADIVYEPFVDLGFIQKDKEITKNLVFKNQGKEEGHVTLRYDNANETLTIEKTNFSLKSGDQTEITLRYKPKEAGLFRVLIDVLVEGQEEIKQIDLNATPVEYTVHLIAPLTKQTNILSNEESNSENTIAQVKFAQTNSINFGSIYFGQSKKIQAFIVNGSPRTLNYRIGFIPALDSEEQDKDLNFLTPYELGKQEMQRVMSASSMRGSVESMSQKKIFFECNSKRQEEQKISDKISLTLSSNNLSMSNVNQKNVVDFIDYCYNAIIQFDELQETRLQILLSARAIKPTVKLSRTYITFGECPVNERRDSIVQIENQNPDIPIPFKIPPISQFKAIPMSGNLKPKSQQDIVVSFQAHNFGIFQNTLIIELLGGIYTLPLKVSGMSIKQSKKEKQNRGPDTPLEDFKQKENFINENDLMQSKSDHKEWMHQSLSTQIKTNAKSEFSDSMNIFMATQQNKKVYVDFLRQSRANRQLEKMLKRKNMKTQPKTIEEIEANPDLDLSRPMKVTKLTLPKVADPLWVAKKIDEHEITQVQIPEFDSKKIIKRKLKEEPESQQERRECLSKLEPEEMQRIFCGPKKIDFDSIVIRSKETRSFTVINNHKSKI